VFTPEDREALRTELIEAARADPRITGAAITGSGSVGNEDRWSDIDLAFGVRDASEVESTLADFSERMYRDHHALHHVDVPSGAWIYRVFLLPSTLQVDLAFAPATDFRARASTFRLVFGTAAEESYVVHATAEQLIGYAWLYALHVRSSIARGKPWQAEYMIGEMRNHVLQLACLRYGLPTREARGTDKLPADVTRPLQDALVHSLDTEELLRAFRAATSGLIREMRLFDEELTNRLEQTVRGLTEIPADALPLASRAAERAG
jgi:hypothetical protein